MFIVTGFTDNNICFLGEMMNRICNFTELDLSANYISNDGIIHFLNNINVATEIRTQFMWYLLLHLNSLL